MAEFSLSALVDAEVEASPHADPRLIAEAVVTQIPRAQLARVVADLLPEYVSRRVTMTRRRPLALPDEGDQVGSRRWRAAAEVLGRREFVNGEWKFLRDCTRADVLDAAESRRSAAAALMANADSYLRLYGLMQERGAKVVGDLGEDEVRGVLAA